MRTLVQFDGQNLYRLAMRAYGPGPPYTWPSYDVVSLAQVLVSRVPGRTLSEVRFYTGVPSQSQDAFWHKFWNNKLTISRAWRSGDRRVTDSYEPPDYGFPTQQRMPAKPRRSR